MSDERPSDVPRWREDFPIRWERDHYITRRELTKFLTLGSGLLAATSAAIAAVGRWKFRARVDGPRREIARAGELAPGDSRLFRYPTEEDPCILVRGPDGELRAFSQVCTHLACAVVHEKTRDALFCPCHHGWFDAATGHATAGPPTRRLPRIVLELEGDRVFAVAREA